MTTITTPGAASTRSELALRSHRNAAVVVPAAPVYDHAFPEDFDSVFEGASTQRSTIGCVIPAYNEEESIASVIEGLLAQTRVPDVIHVVVNNTTDKTVAIASQYAGPHEIVTELGEQFTEVFVHDIGKNPDKKVGALNYGYSLVEGYDYLLGVDGDTVAESHAVENLETEIISDSRIGGISAIYSIDNTFKGIASFLISGQRSQFAAFNLQNLLRGRNMAVLGGQFSVFSTHALREVMDQNHQSTPWVKDSEVEDSLLSLQIKSAGYLTKISPYRPRRRGRHDHPRARSTPSRSSGPTARSSSCGPASAATRRASRSTRTCASAGSRTSACSPTCSCASRSSFSSPGPCR